LKSGNWVTLDSGNYEINQYFDDDFNNLYNDIHYYRIKVNTSNNASFYSNTAIVNFPSNVNIKKNNPSLLLKIYPNPFDDVIQLSDKITAFELLDATGNRLMKDQNLLKRIETIHLPPGIYILNCELKSGDSYRFKLIKL
jgi:hypothetical protein